jgi:hypothetical protein
MTASRRREGRTEERVERWKGYAHRREVSEGNFRTLNGRTECVRKERSTGFDSNFYRVAEPDSCTPTPGPDSVDQAVHCILCNIRVELWLEGTDPHPHVLPVRPIDVCT